LFPEKGKPRVNAGRKAAGPLLRYAASWIAELPRGVDKACQTNVGDEAANLGLILVESVPLVLCPYRHDLIRKESVMKMFAESIVAFLKEEDGPTAVEYAVMLALIVVVCLAAVGTIGTNANAKFEQVGTAIAAN
jgi:pilus assembly protein Flp/PilA